MMDITRRIRIGVSPLSWTNDVLQDLGDDIPLATCLHEAAGYQGIELGRKFPHGANPPAMTGNTLPDFGNSKVN
ncbi:Uncharacterised protein [Serratia rubidaea]|uniref:Myo-inosose-2 dehydratase n=1 Tax=Serratia rubidaea TaxID=61652 RepID=A0A448SR70_SERRU|nr:Uncharacterised protein [Serratia rubidaea]